MIEQTSNTIPLVSDQLLADYSEGRLDPQTERRVELLIANDGGLRDKVLRMIALREALRDDLDARAGKPDKQETQDLVAALEKQLNRPQRRGAMAVWPAAAIAACAAGFLFYSDGGPLLETTSSQIQQAAIQSLLTQDSPTLETVASTATAPQAALVDVANANLSVEKPQKVETGLASPDQQQAMPEIVPDFSAFGFELVETRIIPGDPKDAVHLLYEGAEGRRLSLYYSGSDENRKHQVSVRQEGPLALLFWYADGRSFSMIGEVQRKELMEMAGTITQGLAVDSNAENSSAGKGTNPVEKSSSETDKDTEVQSDA